jgi:hypothetical protein
MEKSPVIIRRPRQAQQNEIERLLIKLITGLTYGKITLVLQDGVVIQVNRDETVRLAEKAS